MKGPLESLIDMEETYDRMTGKPGSAREITSKVKNLGEKFSRLGAAIATASGSPRVSVAPVATSTASAATATPPSAPEPPKARGLSDDEVLALGKAVFGWCPDPASARVRLVQNGIKAPGLPEPKDNARRNERTLRSFRQIAADAWLAKNYTA